MGHGVDREQRRLTAILAADVAGYSRLAGADEEGTLGRCGFMPFLHLRPIGAET